MVRRIDSTQPGPCPRPCLLVNPRSFRASRMGLAGRAIRMVRGAGLDVHEVTDPPSLHARLDQLRDQGVQQIWILSGDGTIQALAEYFAHGSPDWSPTLLLLAGGRANLVPRAVGGYPALPALRRALAALRKDQPLAMECISTLRVEQAGKPARYGFVWAGALVREAVRLTAENRAAGRGWWRHSWFSDPYVLLRWAVRTVVFRVPLPPQENVAVRLPGVGELTGDMRALVASSIALSNAPYNPFAQRGEGPVRFTAISADGPALWRMWPALLRGQFDPSLNVSRGILSGRSDRVELQGIAGFALDGELFSVNPALPVVLTAGRPLRVLRPAA
jgi:hypothetical protein